MFTPYSTYGLGIIVGNQIFLFETVKCQYGKEIIIDRVAKTKASDNYEKITRYGDKETVIIKDKIIHVKMKKSIISVQLINKETLKMEASTVKEGLPKKMKMQSVVKTDNSLTLFYTEEVKSPKKHSVLYAVKINPSNGAVSEPVKLFDEPKLLKHIPSGCEESDYKFEHVYGDYKEVLVEVNENEGFYISYRFAESKNEKLGLVELDASLKKKSDFLVKLSLSRSDFNLMSYSFNDFGELIVVGTKEASGEYLAYIIKEGAVFKEVDLSINKEFWFQKLLIKPSFDGGYLLAAYYLNDHKIHSLKTKNDFLGVYFSKLSREGKEILAKEIPFKSNIKYLEGAKEVNPDQETIERFWIGELEELKDGSFYIGGQQMHRYTRKEGDYTVTYWDNNDIVALKLDASGNKKWMNRFYGGGYKKEGGAAAFLEGRNDMYYVGEATSGLFVNKINKTNGLVTKIKIVEDEKYYGIYPTSMVSNKIVFDGEKSFYVELDLNKKLDCTVKSNL